MKPALRSTLLWGAAFLIAVVLGAFQRVTGPTYPRSVEVAVGGRVLGVSLPRTHAGAGGLRVTVPAGADVRGGRLLWRRFPTAEEWRSEPLRADGSGALAAVIPHQPPAGKVEYRLDLDAAGRTTPVPADGPVVARFRGDVPAAVLVPHILMMFASMMLATAAVLGVLLQPGSTARGRILLATATLMVGGLMLGPAVQWHAFGAWWTGWPVGTDLTDNKTLLAFLAWLPVTVLALLRRGTRTAAVLGWVVMMAVFLIPHSLAGSQIDWEAQAGGASPTPGTVAEVPSAR